MKVHTDFAQNSLEWLVARAGVVTASEFHNLLSPTWKVRTGDMVESYLARKLAEKWLKGPLPGHMTLDMDAGRIREEEAIPWYEFTTGQTVQRVGLITSEDGLTGCSPDGLLSECEGLEVKCPLPQTHVRYLLAGTVPEEYLAQVHGSMFVTGFPRWRFLSYCRQFPPLLITVMRSDVIQKSIEEAVTKFLPRLKEGMELLQAKQKE